MNSAKINAKNIPIIALFFSLAVVFLASAWTIHAEDISSAEQLSIVEGMVSEVSVSESFIKVKPKKGNEIIFRIDAKTLFIGESFDLKDIKKRRWVKVWYQGEGNEVMALQVQQMPELGC